MSYYIAATNAATITTRTTHVGYRSPFLRGGCGTTCGVVAGWLRAELGNLAGCSRGGPRAVCGVLAGTGMGQGGESSGCFAGALRGDFRGRQISCGTACGCFSCHFWRAGGASRASPAGGSRVRCGVSAGKVGKGSG